jgi:hypothetical protein
MMSAPIYETHKRGKNWMAIIAASPIAPGGLDRTFLRRGNGDYYYIVSDLQPNTPVEFGADYYSARGKKSTKRWYGVVKTISPGSITIEECSSGRDAILIANSHQ